MLPTMLALIIAGMIAGCYDESEDEEGGAYIHVVRRREKKPKTRNLIGGTALDVLRRAIANLGGFDELLAQKIIKTLYNLFPRLTEDQITDMFIQSNFKANILLNELMEQFQDTPRIVGGQPKSLSRYRKKTDDERQNLDLDNMTRRNGGSMMYADYCRELLQLHNKSDFAGMMALNESFNDHLDIEYLDLHFLPMEPFDLSNFVFMERLKEISNRTRFEEGITRPENELIVVTGRGRSQGNTRIRSEVIQFATRNNLKCETYTGSVAIKLTDEFLASVRAGAAM